MKIPNMTLKRFVVEQSNIQVSKKYIFLLNSYISDLLELLIYHSLLELEQSNRYYNIQGLPRRKRLSKEILQVTLNNMDCIKSLGEIGEKPIEIQSSKADENEVV